MHTPLTTIAILEEIVGSVHASHPSINLDIVYLNAIKNMADVVSRGRVKAYWKDGSIALLNLYGFVFSGSGGGKDLAAGLVDEFFADASWHYKKELRQIRADMHAIVAAEAQALFEGKSQTAQRLAYIERQTPRVPECDIRKGTEEGIVEARLALKALNLGSTSVTISELAKRLKGSQAQDTSFLDFIMELYEGENKGKVTKIDAGHKGVKDIPNNFLAFTTLDLVLQCPKKKSAFVELFSEGFARRAFVVYDTKKKEPEALLPIELAIEKFRKRKGKQSELKGDAGQYFFNLQHKVLKEIGRVIEFSDTAFYRFMEYMNELAQQESPILAVQQEVRGRYWKAVKLAGIFAVVQGKTEVDIDDVENAIALSEYFGRQSEAFLTELLKKETILETGSDYLAELFNYALEKGFFNKTPINKMFRNASTLRKNEILDELQDYAFEQGYKCVFQKSPRGGNGGNYVLEPIPKVEDIPVSLSLCRKVIGSSDEGFNVYDMASPYEWVDAEDGACDMQTALGLTTCGNYSAGRFKDGYRKAANWLGGNNLLIYDVDEGMTIEAAKSMFLDTACAIMPTKSHQKEKHGLACDRFRVFLPLETPMDFTDIDRFKRIMRNVAESFQLPFDKATIDPSRMFYPASPEALDACWYNQDAVRVIDWAMFDHETMDKTTLNTVARHHNATFKADSKDKALVEKAVRKLCQNHYHKGNRNNTLFRALTWLKDAAFDQRQAESLLQEITSTSPLDANEWKTTIRSAWR